MQVIPLPSLPLPLSAVQHLSMVYCTVTVFLSTVSIYFSLYLSTGFIYLLSLSVYRSFLFYTASTVFIFLQCSFIYSTAPIYLLCKAIFSALLSKDAFLPFLLCITVLLCLSIYTEYMYTVPFYLLPYLTIVDPQRSSRTIRRISSFGIDYKSVILLHCIGLLHLVLFLVIRFSSRQDCSSIVLCLP